MALPFNLNIRDFEHFKPFELVLRKSWNIMKYSEIKCGLFAGSNLAAAALQFPRGK
jgi:hypothetical protein